jgi:hypothetical protein
MKPIPTATAWLLGLHKVAESLSRSLFCIKSIELLYRYIAEVKSSHVIFITKSQHMQEFSFSMFMERSRKLIGKLEGRKTAIKKKEVTSLPSPSKPK